MLCLYSFACTYLQYSTIYLAPSFLPFLLFLFHSFSFSVLPFLLIFPSLFPLVGSPLLSSPASPLSFLFTPFSLLSSPSVLPPPALTSSLLLFPLPLLFLFILSTLLFPIPVPLVLPPFSFLPFFFSYFSLPLPFTIPPPFMHSPMSFSSLSPYSAFLLSYTSLPSLPSMPYPPFPHTHSG